jgi:hypothetical protein
VKFAFQTRPLPGRLPASFSQAELSLALCAAGSDIAWFLDAA